jgi:signal transduction histidine kinase
MLLFFGVAAVQAVRLLGAMRAENQALREQALDRSRKLATVRYCVLLSQQYLNDHSSHGEPVASESDVRNQWTQMMADLAAYRFSNDGDAVRFEQLREMLQQHWLSLNRAMEASASQRELTTKRFAPAGIGSRNHRTGRGYRCEADSCHGVDDSGSVRASRTRFGTGAQFCAGNGASAGAWMRGLHSPDRAAESRRYEEIVAARRDLEQLSARLVDAQETERRTISRELHDQVGQTLNALLVDAANLAPGASRRTMRSASVT